MMNNAIIIVIALWFQIFIVINCTTEQQCFDQLYRQCTHETTFTTKEIQTTQLYLRRRFAVTLPLRAACPISVDNPPCIRKDIKCLSPAEIQNLTSAWVQLYANGVVEKYTKIHSDYWGTTHKFSEGLRWHQWHINRFEKELQNINPAICMPYWNVPQDFAHPELSKVWDIFGHAGNASNDYCVPDGPFANVTCDFPSPHCLRRQWQLNNTIYAWKSPEWYTLVQQMRFNPTMFSVSLSTILSQLSPEMVLTSGNILPLIPLAVDPQSTSYFQRVILFAITSHFDTHLSCGGWSGDLSVAFAPNDPLFHLFHINQEKDELFWQLCNLKDKYLLPATYNVGTRYNNVTSKRSFPNIATDTFAYYSEVYVKEGFQFGYGEMCHLYDVIIKPINYIVNQNLLLEANYPITNLLYKCVPDLSPPLPSLPSTATLPLVIRPLCNPPPLPTAAQRLQQALGPTLFKKYYPDFASNNWWYFCHLFPNISDDCNPVSTACKPMPRAPPFSATLEGQRQYDAFGPVVADFDNRPLADVGQSVYDQFMDDLADGGYCSLFV